MVLDCLKSQHMASISSCPIYPCKYVFLLSCQDLIGIIALLLTLSSVLQVLIGVKFLRQWPFLGRLRICFAEPPYFQMTVKPIFTHGLDVTDLPGIDGWLVIAFFFLNKSSTSFSLFFSSLPFSQSNGVSSFAWLG